MEVVQTVMETGLMLLEVDLMMAGEVGQMMAGEVGQMMQGLVLEQGWLLELVCHVDLHVREHQSNQELGLVVSLPYP